MDVSWLFSNERNDVYSLHAVATRSAKIPISFQRNPSICSYSYVGLLAARGLSIFNQFLRSGPTNWPWNFLER